jgi:elongation factor 2
MLGNETYLVNLIDSPGHVDFSSEVTAALRLSDGALVVVDCVEGVCVQTRTVMRQALQERVKPVLFLNKIDRLFLELNMPLEDMYQTLARTIESANLVIQRGDSEQFGRDLQVHACDGSVGFGSGLHGWAFTLHSFAQLYFAKMGLTVDDMTDKLWGDNFYDAKSKVWTTSRHTEDGTELGRGFCLFVLAPLKRLFDAIMAPAADPAAYLPLIEKLVRPSKMTRDDLALSGKPLLKKVMQTWLPAADVLTSMIAHHLPSPLTAQKYRMETLYSGPADDACATAIKRCDPTGPLMMYVSKMIPTQDGSRFYAFGRVFSGTLVAGATVRIQGPDYCPDLAILKDKGGDAKDPKPVSVGGTATGSGGGKVRMDLNVRAITGAVLMMGPTTEGMGSFSAGMMCGLVGVDQYLQKCGTITSDPRAHNFRMLKFSVSPVVRCAVSVADPQHLAKLQVGLKRLVKSDPLVQVLTSTTGESIVAACGELHLEICLKDLEQDFMNGIPLKVSAPIVSYCETISAPSDRHITTKSASKLNRLTIKAQPLPANFCADVERGALLPVASKSTEGKLQAHKLVNRHQWDPTEAKKVWAFGVGEGVTNVLVDTSKSVPYLAEARDTFCAAWSDATAGPSAGSSATAQSGGVLCGESLRGVRFDIVDAKLHGDATHRGPRQLNGMMAQAVAGIQLASKPALMEPVYRCAIQVPTTAAEGAYATLRARRAAICEPDAEEDLADARGDDMTSITAFLPVAESFGFASTLRKNTGGQAFPQLVFSHWARMPGDPTDPTSLAGKTVAAIRARKGLKPELPKFDDFVKL